MIYKITNIRLRSGRTLNRGFIIESDKMLSRNKIATLIKERTNFIPVDFSSKIHRSLLESDEDVKAAMAAGTAKQNANKETNAGIRNRNEELIKGYKRDHENKVKDARRAESNKFYKNLNLAKGNVPKSISSRVEKLKKLKGVKNNIDTLKGDITNLDNNINTTQSSINQAKADWDEKKGVLDTKKQEYTTAFNDYTNAKTAYTDLLNNKKSLSSKVQEKKTELKTALGNYKDESELDTEISNLESEIEEKTQKLNTAFDTAENNFNSKMDKKYAYNQQDYEDDYNKNKEDEIDVNQGVNFAKVENYFNKKQADLTNIIEEFRKQVKKTTDKKNNEIVVYKRLDKMLNKFNEFFGTIKNDVIEQYDPNAKKQEKQMEFDF